MPSPPSTRPSGARGRRLFVFVREDGEAATEQPSPQRRLASPARGARGYPRRALDDNNDTSAIAFAVLGPRAVEIDVPGPDCVAQAAEQVAQEQRLGVRRFRVPHVGVPRAPAIEIVVPAHGVMSAVRTALVARFIDLDEHVNGRIDRLEVVELVVATEASGQALCRYVRRVEHAVAARAYVGIAGMAVEVRAGQSAVPRPVVLSVRGGVHADVAAARPDVALEDVLLRRIEDVTRRIQEDDRAVSRQVLLRKDAGILRRIDCKPILLSELLYCGDAVGDRAVTKSRRLGEDEHARLLRVCRDGDRDRGEERERDDESGHGTRERWETTATGVRQSAAPFGMWVPPLHARIGLTRQR